MEAATSQPHSILLIMPSGKNYRLGDGEFSFSQEDLIKAISYENNHAARSGVPPVLGGSEGKVREEDRGKNRCRLHGMDWEGRYVWLRKDLRSSYQERDTDTQGGMGLEKWDDPEGFSSNTPQMRQSSVRKSRTPGVRHANGELHGCLRKGESEGRRLGASPQGQTEQESSGRDQSTATKGRVVCQPGARVRSRQRSDISDLQRESLEGTLNKALGSGQRWITVKPHGPNEKGVPVLVQETKSGSGVYHVIGGAGGKLNYLKLRGVKSESNYRKEAAERKKAKTEERKVQRERDKENGVYESKQAAKQDVSRQQSKQEREFIQTVAQSQGWENHEFDATPYLNLSEGAQKKAFDKHHRGWLKKASEAVAAQRERLLADADARAEALGEVSLESDNAEQLSVDDLAPVAEGAGLGYSTDYGKRAKEKGLTDKDLSEEKAEQDDKEPEDKKESAEKRKSTADSIAKELDEVREPGPLNAKVKLVDAEKAVALLKAEKRLKQLQKQARKARSEIDKAVEPKGAYILEVGGSEPDIAKDLADDLKTINTRAFLDEVGKVANDPEKSLGRHIGVGAYNAINAVALTGAGASLVDRDLVDVLGIAGASQVLARRLHGDLTDTEMQDLHHGMESYHVDHYMKATEEAMSEAMRWHDVAKQIEVEAADGPQDLARMQELNAKRRDAIGHAERIMGTTLGEMEANAALVMAMGQKSKDKIEVTLGEISPEDAIRRARAIGLERGDYQINAVGSERFLTVTGKGMDRLARPVDREDLNATRASLNIIEGREDEDNWLPLGLADRPDLAMEVQPGVAPRLAEPFTPGENLEQSIKDYIGGRAADGDTPADILADALSQETVDKVPTDQRDAFFETVDKIAPMKDAEGKMIRAEAHQQAFEDLADQFVKDRHGQERQPLHRQTFETNDHAVESLHRALSAEPAGTLAYKAVGDLDHRDQRGLRNWWAKEVGRNDAGSAELRGQMQEMDDSEPEKEVDDMFGRGTNPEWVDWKQRRDELAEKLNVASLTWPKYVKMMGGTAPAYSAVQDLVRGRVATHFADTHNTLDPDNPIKVGRTVIRGNLNHLDAVDPEAREHRLEQHRQLVDSLRERNAGRYASGSVTEKIAQAREDQAAFEQSQMGFFGAEPEPEEETPLAADQRHTLGHAAERQIAGMMSVVGQNFKPNEPTRLWQASMNGRYINQQRAVKLIDRNKRVVLAQGVGSGKTVIGLGAFTHALEQGKAHKGLFVVPSIVQGQFRGEALRYLEPGKYKWHIEPGASRKERIAGYKDPDTHFSVVTHQSFRDDMLHLGAEQASIDTKAMTEQVQKMTAPERKAWMRGVMDHSGIDHDYLMVDEGHDLLNRAGKANSIMANVVDSVAHNTPYYVNATADPVKNDPSEVYDLLHKMDPERFNDGKAFMRRYGVDTQSSKDELRRELARYFYPGQIDPGVKATRKDEIVKFTDDQQKAMAETDHNLARVRLSRMKGQVDVDAVKALSPNSFKDVPEGRHKAVAEKLARNIGPLRQMAQRRVIDEHPGGGKIERMSRIVGEHKGKPGVVFAHSLTAVKQIADRLKSEGHRVVVLTGADSAKEKARKKLMFKPEAGEAEVDIFVASDAGAVGANLQRGQWLINYDIPDTAKTHAQRNGRINRLGQKNDIDLIDLIADHPNERKARKRLAEKYELRGILTSPMEGLDDTGLASYLNQARMNREQEGLF